MNLSYEGDTHKSSKVERPRNPWRRPKNSARNGNHKSDVLANDGQAEDGIDRCASGESE